MQNSARNKSVTLQGSGIDAESERESKAGVLLEL